MFVKAAAIATLVLGSALAQAQPIDPTNSRPVPVVNSSETTLQSFLDGLFGSGWGTVNGSQSPFGMFRAATSVGTSIPTIVAEFAGLAQVNRFGIWFGNDASNILAVDLLLGPASTGDWAGINIGNGVLEIGSLPSACGARVNCGTLTNSLITPSRFGFFFQTDANPRAFSVDALNPGGESRVLGFQQGATTNWAFAYEDLTDMDFNDMIVKVESIVPVPEASTVAMLLAGLSVLTFVARRRRS